MPQAETRPARIALASRPAPVDAVLGGWGGGRGAPALLHTPGRLDELIAALATCGGRRAIARGMGRSYGDAAQAHGGVVIEVCGLRSYELDTDAGLVRVQAGMTLGRLLGITAPFGWTVPVVPGTQHVTVGGAIASDIHGKNHGSAGTFGAHVRAFGLLTAAGEVVELGPGDELFGATIGGMGLTGVVVWARIALRRIAGAWLSVDTDRVDSLGEALTALRAPGGAHRVAWLDLLGSKRGRGVVTRAADHPEALALRSPGKPRSRGSANVVARASVPRGWPRGLLRPGAVRAHNEVRFRAAPRQERGRIESFGAHMFPLDGLAHWPRLYGPDGFVQYQLVVPAGQERTLELVIERLRTASVPCYLAVLKDFGPAAGRPLSFPIEGWTLALDLPRAAPGLARALDGCDDLVVQAGGRVYLTKDSRLAPETVAAMYPRLREWQAIRDGADPERRWCSDLARRTRLVARS